MERLVRTKYALNPRTNIGTFNILKGEVMKHTIGCTTRPYGALTFAEACEHIAAAGYTDVAVFANAGQIPVRADSTDAEIAETRKAAAAAGLTPSMLIGSTKLNLGLEAAMSMTTNDSLTIPLRSARNGYSIVARETRHTIPTILS